MSSQLSLSMCCWLLIVVMVAQFYVGKAAIKVDLAELDSDLTYSSRKRSDDTEQLKAILLLEKNVTLMLRDQLMSAQGNIKSKYVEGYNGRIIYNTGVNVEVDSRGQGTILSADIFRDLGDDLKGALSCTLPDEEAEALVQQRFQVRREDEQERFFQHVVYIDSNGTAHYTVQVDMFVVTPEQKMSKPHAFVDICDKTMLEEFDNLSFRSAPGRQKRERSPVKSHLLHSNIPAPGTDPNDLAGDCSLKLKAGNPKRPLEFGRSGFCLEVTKSADGNTCFLENEYIRCADAEDVTNMTRVTTASFPCQSGYDDERNGAYSPMLDIFFFSTKTQKMFREWYDFIAIYPPPLALGHYGENLSNAFWDGSKLILGDGNGQESYPYTNLDTIAHELIHGMIQNTSNLGVSGQAGGLNEALADMGGEVAEAYVFGFSDMVSGAELYYQTGRVDRYYDDPTKDGNSIKHLKNFTESLDIHYSSGIYNHVFWLLAQKHGMGSRAAFEIFLTANRLYWRPGSSFEEAACGSLTGAYDSGYDLDLVVDSLRTVGLTLENCSSIASVITAELRPETVQTGLKVSSLRHPLFKIHVPASVTEVTVTASDGIQVSISETYHRSATPLATGVGSASAEVKDTEVLYARFFKADSKELKGVTVTLSFSYTRSTFEEIKNFAKSVMNDIKSFFNIYL